MLGSIVLIVCLLFSQPILSGITNGVGPPKTDIKEGGGREGRLRGEARWDSDPNVQLNNCCKWERSE